MTAVSASSRRTIAVWATSSLALLALLALFILLIIYAGYCVQPRPGFLHDIWTSRWKFYALASVAAVGWTAMSWACYLGLQWFYHSVSGEPIGGFASRKYPSAVMSALVLCGWVALSVFLVFPIAALQVSSSAAISRGNLAALRSGISVYYGDRKEFPRDLSALTREGRYLSSIPSAKTTGFHPDSTAVRYAATSDDSGGWLYVNVAGDANYGSIRINCTHIDHLGRAWSSY